MSSTGLQLYYDISMIFILTIGETPEDLVIQGGPHLGGRHSHEVQPLFLGIKHAHTYTDTYTDILFPTKLYIHIYTSKKRYQLH